MFVLGRFLHIDRQVSLRQDEGARLASMARDQPNPERIHPMAKKQTDSVYRIVDVVGVSEKSWEDAGRRAVETAAGSLRDLRVAEVTKMDMRVENGKVLAFRTRVALSFKYET
jgi:flavin-binding protein dodecin